VLQESRSGIEQWFSWCSIPECASHPWHTLPIVRSRTTASGSLVGLATTDGHGKREPAYQAESWGVTYRRPVPVNPGGEYHRAMIRSIVFALLLCVVCLPAAEHPEAEISNGLVTAKTYLPDFEKGYYRGTRFDWSGVIHSLTYKGHEYFGEWQQSDDPHLHDRITGPVESFSLNASAQNFSKLPAGGTFLRIGVGVCEKPDKENFQWQHTYRVVDPGKWTVRRGENWIEFVQDVSDSISGHGYSYTKRMTLTPGRPELVIDHVLSNTGKKAIETSVYNHNFFVIDGQPTGPDFVVRFPFDLTADRDLKGYGEVRGPELAYNKVIPDGEHIITLFTGYGDTADDNQFAIENRKVKAGVRMKTDKPLSKLQFWSPHTTLCPEPFIDLKVAPGQADRWAARYEFYTLD